MSPDRGGAFDILLGLVRLGLGGSAGDGRQYVSWVHDVDFVRAVRWLVERDDVEGIVNVASPELCLVALRCAPRVRCRIKGPSVNIRRTGGTTSGANASYPPPRARTSS